MSQEKRRPNLLAEETSPYLLQHAYNPVAWYPWGKNAFKKARDEDKPVFLSVGYSTCHWCHVMERESFESDRIAELLNRAFVPVKVDREERPDIDRLYMTYVQATTGSGGWPMSVWLTPDLKPFFGGSYFPPEDRYGKPGFYSLLLSIERAWKEDRNKLILSADGMQRQLEQLSRQIPDNRSLTEQNFHDAARQYSGMFDSEHGGFGSAPKFPQPSILEFLLSYSFYTGNTHVREMVLFTLTKMAEGGIHDLLGVDGKGGGGFSRYATDDDWHVPHFEKMLYDNAQLAVVATEAFRLTGENSYADTVKDILNYVLCDMTDASGGFFSAEDADSFPDSTSTVKQEGGFYLWSFREIADLLEPLQADVFCYLYGVEKNGNVLYDPHGEFTGRNILLIRNQIKDAAERFSLSVSTVRKLMADARDKLFTARLERPRPDRDDKVLTSWNGLMISAFSKASAALENREYLEAAIKAADFILENLYSKNDGTLLRRYRNGSTGIGGKADDYAFFIQGLLDLYEASGIARYMIFAENLMDKQVELFFDDASGGFYNAASNDLSIPVRMKEDYDGAEPSPNSINVLSLLKLADMTDREDFRKTAEKTIAYFSKPLQENSGQLPSMLKAAMLLHYGTRQVVLAGDMKSENMNALRNTLGKAYLPDTSIIYASGEKAANTQFLKELSLQVTEPAAYVCANHTCNLPVTDEKSLEKMLRGISSTGAKR